MRSVAAYLVVLVLAVAAAPSELTRPTHALTIEDPPVGFAGFLGWSIWECYDGSFPVGFVNLRALDTPMEAVVRAHEADHMRFMLGLGTCQEARRALRLTGVRLAMEARGFCVGVRAGVLSGAYPNVEAGVLNASYALMDYGFGLSQQDAAAAVRAACDLT